MKFFRVLVVFITSLHLSVCELCKVCECSRTGDSIEYNCDGKLENIEELDLFMFIDKDPPNKLILSNNDINETSIEEIKYLNELKILDLSHNNIAKIIPSFIEKFAKLEDLNFSWNLIDNFDVDAFEKSAALVKLDLSHNKIENISESYAGALERLLHLDLSNNLMKILPTNFFEHFKNLNSVDFSQNSLKSFKNFDFPHNLTFLNLEHNSIDSINLSNFPFLSKLRIGFNELTSLPANLSVDFLSIENNRIVDINYDENLFNRVQFLNLSGNNLSKMKNFTFSSLEILDISYNKFITIPESLINYNFPKLHTLIVNGNPIKELKFINDLKIRNFIMKDTYLLNNIYGDAFEKLSGYNGDCINLTISSNKNLNSFDEGSLRGLHICYLDLSDNGFTRVSKSLEIVWNGSLPKYGINLQGNPFICDCRSEWMLEELIPKLYDLNPELLVDLKCNKPQHLFNKRMVHWMKWKGQVFCDDTLSMNDYSRLEIFEGRESFVHSRNEIALKSGSGMLIIILIAGTTFLLLVIAGLILSYKLALKKRRLNRRF